MNNDELFCYLINQIAHYDEHAKNKKVKKYADKLKKYDFFKELCESKNYYRGLIYRMYKDTNDSETMCKFIKKENIKDI